VKRESSLATISSSADENQAVADGSVPKSTTIFDARGSSPAQAGAAKRSPKPMRKAPNLTLRYPGKRLWNGISLEGKK